MKERTQRSLLLLIVVPLFIFHWKSHGTPLREESMAFVRYTGSYVTVRVQGDVKEPGVYKFYDGDILMSAIKMTAPKVSCTGADKLLSLRKLEDGTVLHIRRNPRNCAEISVLPLPVIDKILLGVPLDPDRLSLSEWESLPGIGPSLAGAIIKNRQVNGAFRSLIGVTRVPGVGERKVAGLIKYF